MLIVCIAMYICLIYDKCALFSAVQRSGSSGQAIKKVIGEKYKGKLPTGWERMTGQQLKRLADKGELVRVKASFKLGEVSIRTAVVAGANAS